MSKFVRDETLDPDHPVNDVSTHGQWHMARDIDIPGSKMFQLKIRGVVCGCGLAQLYGLSEMARYKVERDWFIQQLTQYKNRSRDAGSFIATLGQSFYTHHDYMLSLGFTQISEYENNRHSKGYMQRLYIIHV